VIATASHARSIAAALEALEVRSSTAYAWMGELAELPGPLVRLAGTEGVRAGLVASIGWRLYESFYTQGTPRRPVAAATPALPDGRTAMSHQLAAANGGTSCLEAGWRILAEEDGRWIVQRGGLRLWADDGEIASAGGGPPQIGDVVAVRLPADLPLFSPGYYTARGDRGFSGETPRVLDRVYLSLRPEGAVTFIQEATRRLNREGLAFVAKVVDDPDGFDRRDSAVLAFERADRVRGLAAAEELGAALEPYLGDGAPAMTLPLGPGLAFAEDPGGGESFGAHRCRLIAEAAVDAADRGLRALDDRLAAVERRFAEAGTTLEAPYLGPERMP
jgi:hypothetical protein